MARSTSPSRSRSRSSAAAGGPESLDEAAKLLAEAKFPVIMAGGGVVMCGAQAQAVKLAEYLQAPVVTSLPAQRRVPQVAIR